MRFSVIMPIFNAEKNLHKSINSILNQDFNDFELILVNDASKDRSLEICNKFAAENKNIVVIDKKINGGVAKARNSALEIAQGEYICFIDSDDEVAPSWLSNYNIPSNPDLLCCGFHCIDEHKISTMKFNKDALYSKEELYDASYIIAKNSALNPPWSKCYKTEIIKRYGIRFLEGCDLFEDLIFSLSFMTHVKSIQLLEYVGYLYHRENSTLTRKFHDPLKYIAWSQEVIDKSLQFTKGDKNIDIFKRILRGQYILASFYPILHYSKMSKESRYLFYKYINKISQYTTISNIPLNRFIYKFYIEQHLSVLDTLIKYESKAYIFFREVKSIIKRH